MLRSERGVIISHGKHTPVKVFRSRKVCAEPSTIGCARSTVEEESSSDHSTRHVRITFSQTAMLPAKARKQRNRPAGFVLHPHLKRRRERSSQVPFHPFLSRHQNSLPNLTSPYSHRAINLSLRPRLLHSSPAHPPSSSTPRNFKKLLHILLDSAKTAGSFCLLLLSFDFLFLL
uniref:Uncharacterized protein n=1 Tax=Arundo donax TaxID=35708 RepID=A0A0A9DAI2_ARUDO